MSETSKKQNFLQGAALLAIATAIVKLIGAFYKLPLNMAIGAEGYSYFTTAYDIYSVMLLISTAGLPVAVSRMISQASTLEQYTRMRKIFRTALSIFAIMGALTYGTWWALTKLGIGSRVILCGAPIAVGVAVYVVAAVKFRAITREDCLLLPKGEKIAKLLHL